MDYVIDAALDEAEHRIRGTETITYTNNSPDVLRYLWVQLDQNMESKDAEALLLRTTDPAGEATERSYRELGFQVHRQGFEGGHQIAAVTDATGGALPHTIVGTMLRVDLPAPLRPRGTQVLRIA